MAQKFEDDDEPNFSRLLSTLLESGVHNSNNALYQVIATIIKNVNSSFKSVRSKVAALSTIISGTPSGGGIVNATYLTVDNEIATLPNSRRVLAGSGIEFDDSIANVRIIRAEPQVTFIPGFDGEDGEDGIMGMPGLNGRDGTDLTETSGYWSPLTDGDLVAAELIFANGDTVSVWTPTP